MMVTKEGILDGASFVISPVTFGRGLGIAHVRGLSLREYESFERAVAEAKKLGLTTLRAELLVRSLCDEKGVRLFADGDVEIVGALDYLAFEPAFLIACVLVGLQGPDRPDVPCDAGGGM